MQPRVHAPRRAVTSAPDASSRRGALLACAVAGVALLAPAWLGAQGGAGGATSAATGSAAPTAGSAVRATFTLRTRGEAWRWFDAPDADGRYTYLGAIARLGVGAQHRRVGWTLEAAAPLLVGLPDDALAAAPRGQLGLGATYFTANDRERTVARLFVKQALVRLGAAAGRSGHAVRLGRFEFADGAELTPADPTLAALKSSRVAQRLIGPFAWTHVGRAFDGVHYTYDRAPRPDAPRTGGAAPFNVTLAAFAPTEGAFEANAWRPMPVYVGYGAYTRGVRWRGGAQGDARVFALHYDDRREPARFTGGVLPAAQRPTGDGRVRVSTLGGHLLHVQPTAAGALDLLAWGAVQGGRWGRLDHRAHAAALEAGWQPSGVPWRPWLRGLWFRGSGDASATDDAHGTFFEVLPTPRIYARFPIHNLMNVEQGGASLTLRPHARLTLRADAQALRLADPGDLWYLGGGAFERESFGYAGRPGGGRRRFASLADLSVDLRLTRRVAVNAYVARAGARDVVRAVHPDTGPASFGYVELDLRR